MSKGEETKQLIIERAAPVFNTRGIAATAMSDIMEVTKLSKGSLYVHFTDKDNLAASVVDYSLSQLSKKVMTAVNRHSNAKDRLFAYIDVLGNPLQPLVAGGCPMMNFGVEADDTNQAIREKVSRLVKQSQKTIAGIIHKGIEEGVFKPDWEYKEFATMLFAMIEGGIMISRITGNDSAMKTIKRNLKNMITAQLL
ncbi:TetR/AcrR family transcriptional regulator [Deminuibacter soli]|uniref:TetR/AcrR family transcriptional regulator n=1 Tax=Deminuibacter soli TaxID=2291815 RepID=A0A3E1NFX7_9BACT|nr:TetR/AcrR family transcriptional regulator [Deminuibacter soli]RFM26787.1 TetR/AcrR family transcriptional regulator [Deminuibacter soli]